MKSFFTDFKRFALRGNVVDLAVGVIIGGAFGNITSSLVRDIITPVIDLAIGEIKLTEWHAGPFAIGNFIQASLDFVIIALVVFVIIKIINSVRRMEGDKVSSEIAREEQLLTEIRDLLKQGK